MTLEAMRPAGSSATSTLSGDGGPEDGACGSGDAASCELDVVLGLIGSASIPEPGIVIEVVNFDAKKFRHASPISGLPQKRNETSAAIHRSYKSL